MTSATKTVTIAALPVPIEDGAEIKLQFELFSAKLKNSDEIQEENIPEIVLSAMFVEFVVLNGPLMMSSTLFEAFSDKYCSFQDNIHVCAKEHALDNQQVQVVLRAYYLAAQAHNQYKGKTAFSCTSHFNSSALFNDPSFSRLAMFGGQGGMDNYIEETRSVYMTYFPLVCDYVKQMSEFLCTEAAMPKLAHLYSHGLDVITWLDEPHSVPHLEYMVSVPVCIPIVGLTQLMQVMVLYKTFGINPGDLANSFSAIAGHSQGITVAAVFSMVTDEESFYNLSKKALGLLMLCGAFPQIDYPVKRIAVPITNDDQQNITPMVSILKLNRNQISTIIDQHNSLEPDSNMHVYLSLTNGAKMYVVSGALKPLDAFVKKLHKEYGTNGKDQSRVPYSQRKPGVYTKFLNINAPYHCKLLEHAAECAHIYAAERGWILDASTMRRPVRAGDDGHDIRQEKDIVKYLFQSMCVLPVNWPVAIGCDGITHVIDFGPGGLNGFGQITQRILEGCGVVIICAGAFTNNQSPTLASKVDLYLSTPSMLLTTKNWAQQFGPKLVKTKYNNDLHIDTKLSRLLGKPPIMVAGMTPSTVSKVFVSSVINAGYHIELSGGGHFSESMLRDKVDQILSLVGPGQGITVNSIYVNPFLWNIQYPAILAMRREGIPMEGLCIGAGVPSIDVCNEIISNIRSAGFQHIGLKPGSISAINLVIKIAQANPDFPIMLQWTGGRGGGHHSYEDFHQPIIETYGAIRAQNNVVLVAGSGFGGVDDTLPYITGEWSSQFNCAPMPFDGCLLGSRVMVAKEGAASLSVKKAIVAAPGIKDAEWENTYNGPAGGIITVLSEMGEPIHKIATRGVLLWKELDDTVFSLPREKRLSALLDKKNYIIKRLNDDYQKPWFGRKADGTSVDLEEMTYAEVINRLIEVLYISHQSRWIDITMRNLVGDFLMRLEERFSTDKHPAILQSFEQINLPFSQIDDILEAYPESNTQLLTTEDVQFFISLCKRPGQKPVPFIPLMDKDFHIWFKKDSLWQAEDIEAVPGQDVGRVCILQGPVAAHYSTKINEPVKEILDGIYKGQIANLLEKLYDGDESRVPIVEYLGAESVASASILNYDTQTHDEIRMTVPALLPESNKWFGMIHGNRLGWLHALLTVPIIAQGSRIIDNPVIKALQPQSGQVALIKLQNGVTQSVVILNKDGRKEASLQVDNNGLIHFIMFTFAHGQQCSLETLYQYSAKTPKTPIYEIMEERIERIKCFYAQLWFKDFSSAKELIGSTLEVHRGTIAVPTQNDISEFCRAIGMTPDGCSKHPPLDYAMKVFWPALCACLMSDKCYGDLRQLVHVSNSFEIVDKMRLSKNSLLGSEAQITEITDDINGRTMSVKGLVTSDSVPAVIINTAFLFRDHNSNAGSQINFKIMEKPLVDLTIRNNTMLAQLYSKEWFVPISESNSNNFKEMIRVGVTLRFKIVSQQIKGQDDHMHVSCTGQVFARSNICTDWVQVANVDCEGNAAISFLDRHGKSAKRANYFNGRLLATYTVHVPQSAAPYGIASGDYNAIHTNYMFATTVGLPGPITHGMWTSAAVRGAIVAAVCDDDENRMRSYSTQFVGIVFPGDMLTVHVRVAGLCDGNVLVTASADSKNGRVLNANAEIMLPSTALLFGGQGTQKIGMGMDLYAESTAAAAVWNAADAALHNKFGLSLLQIVRDNPKELTIHFAGQRGAKVRAALHQLLPAKIAPDVLSFTFKSSQGLLNATQFSQPALLVAALAETAHLRSLGAFPEDAIYAGHSLGEFAALAAAAQLFTPETAAILGFVRGMTMLQVSSSNSLTCKSQYAMVAVSPVRVASRFNAKDLINIVNQLSDVGSGLLEVVNHNVCNSQYVVAGEVRLLTALVTILTKVSKDGSNISDDLINIALKQTQIYNDLISLESQLTSHATVPIPGIDIPFHSTLLYPGVDIFRNLLLEHLPVTHINIAKLRNRYIPNLTGKPFNVDKSYFEEVYEKTNSRLIECALESWNENKLVSDSKYAISLAHILLIELLSFQFASPVHWIETQSVLLQQFAVKRTIEVSTTPLLSKMLHQTCKSMSVVNPPTILSAITDIEEITFKFGIKELDPKTNAPDNKASESQNSISVDAAASLNVSTAEDITKISTTMIQAPVAAPLKGRKQLEDCSIPSLLVVCSLIAYKLKCGYSSVSPDKPIKDFVAGKSTLQNEIVGDLQKEFGDEVPDKPEEMPLSELSGLLPAHISSLGKHSMTLVSRMIASKMPGTVSRAWISDYLGRTYYLGKMRQQALLLIALTMEPSARLDSETSAKAWLDSVAAEYAVIAKITYAAASDTIDEGNSGSTMPVINSEEFIAAQNAQKQLVKRLINTLAGYLDYNSDTSHIDNKPTSETQIEVDLWVSELGSAFSEGIQPVFSANMVRKYDSWWNWACQDLVESYYAILDGKLLLNDCDISHHRKLLLNHLSTSVVKMLEYMVHCSKHSLLPNNELAYKFSSDLLHSAESTLTDGIFSVTPSYYFTDKLMAPSLRIAGSGSLYGSIEYFEVPRGSEKTIADFVSAVTMKGADALLFQRHALVKSPLDVIMEKLNLNVLSYVNQQGLLSKNELLPPMVHICSKNADDTGAWKFDNKLSAIFTETLNQICDYGLSLSGKYALITGCGIGSIGAELLKILLTAGANVVVTTSKYSRNATKHFEQIYQKHGAQGSSLVVVPFNQASRQDVDALVEFIYADSNSKIHGLGWDLDFVLPFAAISETGRDITNIDSHSELAHRAMLTNTIRLLGAIASTKNRMGIDMHPTLAVLPLSPNHGAFGGDGLYSESKAGLETLLERWHSEKYWKSQISIAAAVIGWTRGTGLMSANNILAQCVERSGIRTFSPSEMAFIIAGLLHSRMYELAARNPIWADITGHFQHYPNVIQATSELRSALGELSSILKATAADSLADYGSVADSLPGGASEIERVFNLRHVIPRSNHQFKLPQVKEFKQLHHLHHLQGMVNLDKVVVITGYGEVGPYGNAETRWEMEAFGEFSLEGCIEMAWIMGLIKHSDAKNKHTGRMYTGWVDAKTNEPVQDKQIKMRYEKYILEHTGIRLIEPELMDGYDPLKKPMMRELQIEHDMEPFEATEEEAHQFKLHNSEHVRIWPNNGESKSDSGTWFVRFLKGATLMVPKALRFDRLVAAQLPTGWDPVRFGIPKNIADQIDPITCYAVVATVEALLRSGITDPYEIYRYVHVSEVGSSTGSALGGLRSTKRVFAERLCDKDQQPDIYQETFLSTPPAWINMLLMSASGPIKTTIGACATGIASIDVAVDTIQSGKAKIMLAGGTDAICEESSYEFAQMNATSSATNEFAQGRTAAEMSRPCTSTRNGFMESEGAGIVTLMSANTALEMGAPIYGIVAMTGTATDKEGRSVPAPGKGVLTSAREVSGNALASAGQLLDIGYRSKQLSRRKAQIDEWLASEYKQVLSQGLPQEIYGQHMSFIEAEAQRQISEALDTWGNAFWKHNPAISPLRGSLAVWGLSVDDIGIASFHGTSTKANDKNESEIIDRQLEHLGRTPGNPVFAICQKYLTGHPKGPASIWMLNGILQSLSTGIIPGNRNADNIAPELEKCKHIVYPSRSIQSPGIKAGLLKSFGFGQVGAECLVVHPDYLFATLKQKQLDCYREKVSKRQATTYRYWHNVLADVHPMVQIKDQPPYSAEQEEEVYLNPLARLGQSGFK